MGHNVDLGFLGMCAVRCSSCGRDYDLEEIDIDCDVKTHRSMEFELSLQCQHCENEEEKTFRIVEDR